MFEALGRIAKGNEKVGVVSVFEAIGVFFLVCLFKLPFDFRYLVFPSSLAC
jgi:hypothetical protein